MGGSVMSTLDIHTSSLNLKTYSQCVYTLPYELQLYCNKISELDALRTL